jgi:hypothetical protein
MTHDMQPPAEGGEMRCTQCGIECSAAYISGSDECPAGAGPAALDEQEQARMQRIWAAVRGAAGVG